MTQSLRAAKRDKDRNHLPSVIAPGVRQTSRLDHLIPPHRLIGLIGRHKKVPYLSVGISITMVLRSRTQQEVRMSAEAPRRQ